MRKRTLVEAMKDAIRDILGVEFQDYLIPGGRQLDAVCLYCHKVIVRRVMAHDDHGGPEGVEDCRIMKAHRLTCRPPDEVAS